MYGNLAKNPSGEVRHRNFGRQGRFGQHWRISTKKFTVKIHEKPIMRKFQTDKLAVIQTEKFSVRKEGLRRRECVDVSSFHGAELTVNLNGKVHRGRKGSK